MSERIHWPTTFTEIRSNPPPGYSVSEIVVDPQIYITRADNCFVAEVVGVVRGGNRVSIPIKGSNYIVDGTKIRPLPRDVNDFFQKALINRSAEHLTLADVIFLLKTSSDDFPIFADKSIFEIKSSDSATMSLEAKIAGLDAEMYPYQEQGVAWMQDILRLTGGVILADEMGLGKTLQIIAILLLLKVTPDKPALIVCTTTLIANWVREILRFARSLSVYVHRGNERVRIYKELNKSDVVITTYDTVVSDISLLRSIEWSIVVADEAQALKNPLAARRKAICQIHRDHTIAVTGTPVENSIRDLWSLSDFVIPGILGTVNEFDLNFHDDADSAQRLASLTAPFRIRRRVSDVASDLPERIDCDIPIELGDNLSNQYENIRKEVFEEYRKAAALVATGRLQLFCAHPWLCTENYTNENWEDRVSCIPQTSDSLITPKMARTIELLDEAFQNNKKVLVFSVFNKISEFLQQAGKELPSAFWGVINGSTPQEDRQNIVDEFTNHDGPGVLILNPKAAGSGLNITASSVVIHYTQVWNPAIEAQASARAHRRGQVNPVTVYRLYYENTVEQIMLDRTLWKKSLANDAVPISLRDQSDLSQALSISPLL